MQLFDEAYRVSSAFDRMGLRLDGQKLKLKEALAIPSEPILRGAVQVSGDGVASVLLADHGTTGGYPKIACVVGSSLDAFVHHRSGDRVRFAAVSPAEAVALTRKTVAKRATYLTQVRVPRGRLETRLMRENLVSGVTLGDI
jgi:allophanate hydrolase